MLCPENMNKELLKIAKHKRSYRVLNKDEINKNLEDDITRLSCLLSVPRPAGAILLHNYTWNVYNLRHAWFDNEDAVRDYVGLSKKNNRFRRSGEVLVCGNCSRFYCFDIRFERTVGFCGHSFCAECLGAYVSKAIDDGPACLFLRCPVPHCGAGIGQDVVDLVVSDEGKMKYKEFSIRSYVENNKEIKWEIFKGIKWCPAPGCENAIEYDLTSESYDVSERFEVTCDCSLSFCWNCLGESHSPVKCETVAAWMLENTSMSETKVPVFKLCPKCNDQLIENKKVTMHMTCECKHEFCWICLSPYEDHDYTVCNSYRDNVEQEIGVEERVTERAKMRHYHYYERWVENQKSRERALASLYEMKTEKIEKLWKLVKDHGLKERGFKFLAKAWEQIVECRRVLKWSYAYGYYMPEEASSKTKLFEYLQGQAELALERLHDCAENILKKYAQPDGLAHELDASRIELNNRTSATRKYFANFVKGVSNGLAEAEGDPLET